jgi:hypothetical protein
VPEDYFGEEIAARYDLGGARPMFSPEAINPVVDFLVELAGDGLDSSSDRHGSDRTGRADAASRTASISRGHGRPSAPSLGRTRST